MTTKQQDRRFNITNNPFFVGMEDLLKDIPHLAKGLQDNYPPHDIIKLSDNRYEIHLAVAGFTRDQLDLTVEKNILTVTSNGKNTGSYGEYIHKGISKRDFTRTFRLNPDVEVEGADMKDGLLIVRLKRIIPESDKPKTIRIG